MHRSNFEHDPRVVIGVSMISTPSSPMRLDLCSGLINNPRNKTRQGYARQRTLKPAGYLFLGFFVLGSRKLYNTLLIIVHMLDFIAPNHHWRQRLKALIGHHHIAVHPMDFPTDWTQRTIWQEGVL